jgi:predicted  nucleic acid-binding Zn-ribbon protein
MASDGVVINHRHGSRSVPRGGKRPAEVQGSNKRSPKRPKTVKVNVKESSSSGIGVLHPQEVLSRDVSSHAASAVVKPVASSTVNVTSLWDYTVTSNDATTLAVEPVASSTAGNATSSYAVLNVLPTLPTAPFTSGTKEPKAVEHEKKGSTLKEGNQTSERANGTTDDIMIAQSQSHVCCHDFFEPQNGHGWLLTFANLGKRLFGMGAIALLLFDVYQSFSYNNRYSNVTMTGMKAVKLDGTLHRAPRRPLSSSSTTTLWNLLAIDNYENIKSTLAMVKKDLARAMNDLERSRNNVGEAREEATKARNDYESVVSELEQTKNELMNNQHELNLVFQKLSHTQEELKHIRTSMTASKADNQRRIHIASLELNHTQEELERERKSLTISEMELKATLQELDAAHFTIDDLHNLLQVQETVAAHALNFVATTAVNRHFDEMHRLLQVQETVAAQALNFVATMAVNSQYNEIAE